MLIEIRDVTGRDKAYGSASFPDGVRLGDIFAQDERLRQLESRVSTVHYNGVKMKDWKQLPAQRDAKVVITYLPGEGITLLGALQLAFAFVSLVTFFVSLFNKPKSPKVVPETPVYSVDGLRSTFTPGNPVPVIYGEHDTGGQVLMFYVDVIDKHTQQFAEQIAVSEGPVESIADFRINGIPAAEVNSTSFASRLGASSQGLMTGFEVIKNTFYDGRGFNPDESDFSSPTPNRGVRYVYPTVGNDVRAVDLQILMPDGVFASRTVGKKAGKIRGVTLTYRVEYSSQTGANHGFGDERTSWVIAGNRSVSDASRGSQFDNYHLRFPCAGAWNVGLTYWDASRGIRPGLDGYRMILQNVTEYRGNNEPWSGTALASVRGIGTKQIHGGRPEMVVNVRGRTVDEYTSATSFTNQWTQNPAWAVRDYMTNSIYGMGPYLTNADLNLQSFVDFATLADSQVEVCSKAVIPCGVGGFCDKSHDGAIRGAPIGNTIFGDDASALYAGNNETWQCVSRHRNTAQTGICLVRVCCPHGTPPYITGVLHFPDTPGNSDAWCDAPSNIAQYISSSGSPRSGLIGYVQSGSTIQNFTGYAFIFDQTNDTFNVMRYKNDDLTVSSAGTVLQSVPGSVTLGHWLFLYIDTNYDVGTGNMIEVKRDAAPGAWPASTLVCSVNDVLPPTGIAHVDYEQTGAGLGGVICLPVDNSGNEHDSVRWRRFFQECGTCYTGLWPIDETLNPVAAIDLTCNDPDIST